MGNGFLGAIHNIPCGLPTQASFTGPGGLENEESHASYSVTVPSLYCNFPVMRVSHLAALCRLFCHHVSFSFFHQLGYHLNQPPIPPLAPSTFDVYILHIFSFFFHSLGAQHLEFLTDRQGVTKIKPKYLSEEMLTYNVQVQ